jgi:hypothetical protein
MSLSELKEHGRVRPSFLGFHRVMKVLTDVGVQEPYEAPRSLSV